VYRLDDLIGKFADLVELSSAEYAAIGRQFEGERNYNAPPTLFLGRSWNGSTVTVRPGHLDFDFEG
jgi:hypothetical protein